MSAKVAIIGGEYVGHNLIINAPHHRLEVKEKFSGTILEMVPLVNIASLELLTEESFKAADAAIGGTLGFFIGGPIGAAVGAGLSRDTRECNFVIKTTENEAYVCHGQYKFLGMLKTSREIALADREHSLELANDTSLAPRGIGGLFMIAGCFIVLMLLVMQGR